MEILLPFTNLGTEQDRFLTGFNFNLTDTNDYPVYRVSVKCRNRAGLWSNEALSSPIKIVPEDQAGIVQDGPVFGQDDDYQTDLTTVTVTFHGFHSSKDDIAHYLWAVGTEPLLDDVMPFVPEGIMDLDLPMLEDYESPHQAQIIVELRSSTKYYITVRGITGAGHVLESSSNGVTLDTSPPEAEFLEVGSGILKEGVMYQQDVDTLTASWNVTDPESSLNTTSVLLETYQGDDTETQHILSQPAIGSLPNAAMKPRDEGKTNILTLQSTNKVGLTVNYDSYPVVVDRSAPTDGQLTCPAFISDTRPLRCDWSGFTDIQSGIDHYLFSVGYEDGDDSILSQSEISGNTSYLFLPGTLNQNLSHGYAYYATLYAVNYVGLKSSGVSVKMVVDETPPEAGNIVILGDTAVWNGSHKIEVQDCSREEGCVEPSAICQRSTTSLQVKWSRFNDEESGILKFELALGHTPGGTQILDYMKLPSDQTMISFDHLDLSDVRQVFVTVNSYNGAGRYRTVTSTGVYISRVTAGQHPLRSLIVRDGRQRGVDLDFQNVNDELSANWDFTGDPCPLQKLEWTVQRADGLVLLPFTELEPGATEATVDRVRLHDGETYRVTLRATNLLHFTHVIRSDGVTLQMEPLLPGVVRDGNIIGYDLTYQTSSESLSANWEGFGVERSLLDDAAELEAEIGQHQELLYYEVAAGTDRRYPATRENIRPFSNVGLNKTWTFTDLELVPESAIYYMTVRAHSTSTATAEVTSNGIRVGHVIQPLSDGEITVPRYVSSATQVEFSWKGFLFVTPIIRYQWAIASYNSRFGDFNCTDLQNDQEGSGVVFDVKPLSQAGLSGLDTVVIADELVMIHGETYTIFVTATSQSGGCILATSEFTVDVTPPGQGSLLIANSVDKGVSFVADADNMMVHWTGYADPESEVTSYEILLIEGDSCSAPAVEDKGDQFIRMSANITSFRFMKLGLQENVPYFLILRTYNGAGSSMVTRSLPIMLDSVTPTPGSLMDGLNLLSDLRFQSSLTEMTGTFLYVPSSAEEGCPTRHFPFNSPNPQWHFVQTKGINQDLRKRIRFSQYQVAFSEASGAEMKIERAVTEELVQSAALLSTAELGRGGRYKFEIKSASSNMQAVTSVALRTGSFGEVWDYGLDEAHENRGSTIIRPDPISGDTATSKETSWEQIEGFGFQIMPRTNMSRAAILRVWAKSGNDTTSIDWQFRFDPSEDYHLYEMVVNDGKPDVDKGDWTLTVFVDGFVRAYTSGIPELPDDAVIQLSIWNLEDYVPQMNTEDVFNQPFASSFFRNAVLPAPVSAMCRYASLFRGGLSPVEKIMAGVGSEPLLNDLVQFQEVTPPCVPCTNPCLTCDPSCSDTETQLIHVHLTGLDLPRPPPVTDGNTSLPVYYLTISAVTGSGATATASSDGVMIDVTPPDLIYLYHLDVSWPDPEPTVYQGSNSTIAVVAYATDNETAIVDYAWSIGSVPGGEDIQTTTSVGPLPVLQNTSLTGVLQDNKTYYVTVVVTNEAGLTTTKISDGVTMMYSEPDESQTATGIYESAPAVTSMSRKIRRDVPKERVVSSRQDGITVTWDAPRSPAAGSIHFGLSSSPEGRRDIFPNMRVGANNSGTVTLDQDGIHRQGERLGNISDARYLRRRTRSTENRFLMEPGRMIYLNMEVCTKGHKCSPMKNKVVVIKRPEDTLCTTPPGEKIQCTLNLTGGKQILVTSSEVQTHEVPLMIGELTPDALKQEYTSAATEEFRPFVVDPENTRNQTERKLNQRIHQWEDINFFITDLSEKGITGPVTITFPFSNLIYTSPGNYGPQLLTWNSELLYWEYTLSSCSPEERQATVDFISGTATVTLCSPRSVTVPGCRQDVTSPPTTYPGPAFLSVAAVSNTFHNTAPVPTSHRYFSMPQDGGTLHTILKAWDAEGDDLEWSLDPSYTLPLNGHADVTPNGIFEYRPCVSCRGNETIRVIIKEARCDGEQALSTQLDLNIYVQAMVTNPSVYLISSSAHVFIPDGRNHVETVLEQRTGVNVEYKDLVLLLVSVHIDGESTDLIHDLPLRGQLTVSQAIEKPVLYLGACSEDLSGRTKTFIDAVLASRSSPELPVPCSIHRTLPSAAADPFFSAQVVVYTPDYQFYGFDQMKFIARTETGLHSPILTQDLYVAENPCENNGTCIGPSEDSDCTHKQRASGFENYWCLCPAGFTGRFCEVDIDECLSQPCPENFTCVDMISGYECHCDDGWPCSSPAIAPGNNNWIFGLAGACGALVLAAAVGIWYYLFHKRLPNKIVPAQVVGDAPKVKRPRSAWSDEQKQDHKKKPTWRSTKVHPIDGGDMEMVDVHLDVTRNFLGSSSDEATRKAAEQLHF